MAAPDHRRALDRLAARHAKSTQDRMSFARTSAHRLSLLGLPFELREMIFAELCKGVRPAVVHNYERMIYQIEPKSGGSGLLACTTLWFEYRPIAFQYGLIHFNFRYGIGPGPSLGSISVTECVMRIDLPIDLAGLRDRAGIPWSPRAVKTLANRLLELKHVERLAVDISLIDPITKSPHDSSQPRVAMCSIDIQEVLKKTLFSLPSIRTFSLMVQDKFGTRAIRRTTRDDWAGEDQLRTLMHRCRFMDIHVRGYAAGKYVDHYIGSSVRVEERRWFDTMDKRTRLWHF
nr:hypothetical protein B0A51_00137 [Rachicladosporium sp. CCFEE 5018]